MPTGAETRELARATEDELRGGVRFLRFSPRIEALYEAETGYERINYGIKAGLSGIVLYGAFIVADMSMIPDVVWISAIVRAGIVPALSIVLMTLVYFWRSPWMRDVGQAAMAILCVAGILYLMLMSAAPLRSYQHYGVSLVLLYTMVLQQVTFRCLTLVVGVSVALYIAALSMVPEIPGPVRLSAVLVMVGIGGSVLVSGYMLEHKSRMFYLLRLQDSLRNKALDATAKTDPLTGLGNRRRLDEKFDELWSRPGADRRSAALIMLDIDYFKRFNDRYGHPAGDACIVEVARCGLAALRPTDLGIRFGGEELVFLLDGCDLSAALVVAERIRGSIEAAQIAHEDGPAGVVTVSLGVASVLPSEAVTPSELIAAADAALYLAKQTGRNRVCPPAPGCCIPAPQEAAA